MLLVESSTCGHGPRVQHERIARRLRRVHGALVYDGRRGLEIYAGTAAIYVYGVPSGGPRPLVAALRPFDADAPPASLPPPAFGDKVWRKAGREGRARLRALGARHRHCG